ncbi:MAG TPA: MATE family efflux transporter, partial [Polyangiaceae bacterium]|nr:MATE family efflux transporter [Polyangiaceae bacterium]
ILSFGLALYSASKVKVGEALGRGDQRAVRRSLVAFVRLAWPLGAISTVVAIAVVFSLLPRLAGEGVGELAAEYTAIRALSFPLALWVAALASWLQAQGKPRAPMLAALIGVLVHVPLNAWLLFGLGWGVRGLAVASFASQAVEAAALWWLVRPHLAVDERVAWRESWSAFVVGLPTGIERVLDMAAFAAVPLLLAQVGAIAVASHQIALQLSQFSFLPLIALSDGGAILVSQAVGANRRELVARVGWATVSLASLTACALAAGLYFGRFWLVGWFTSEAPLLASATATLVFAALLQFVNATYNALKGILRGLSEFRFVARVTVGVAWIITPPLTWLVGVRYAWGAPGAWAVLCVEVSLGTLLLVRRLAQLRSRTLAAAVAPVNPAALRSRPSSS